MGLLRSGPVEVAGELGWLSARPAEFRKTCEQEPRLWELWDSEPQAQLTEAACFRARLIRSLISDRFLLRFSSSVFKGFSRSNRRLACISMSFIFLPANRANKDREARELGRRRRGKGSVHY